VRERVLKLLSDGQWHSHSQLYTATDKRLGDLMIHLYKEGIVERRETTYSGDHWVIQYRIRKGE
jgi:hypothetical protein